MGPGWHMAVPKVFCAVSISAWTEPGIALHLQVALWLKAHHVLCLNPSSHHSPRAGLKILGGKGNPQAQCLLNKCHSDSWQLPLHMQKVDTN